MRLHLRLYGQTASAKKCMMEGVVYAGSAAQLQEEAKKMATIGPWYYAGTAEAVPKSETVIVEHVEQGEEKRRSPPDSK